MKKLYILTITTILALTSNSISAERDCANPKGFHDKLMCKQLINFGKQEVGNTENKKSGIFKKIGDWQKKMNKNKTLVDVARD